MPSEQMAPPIAAAAAGTASSWRSRKPRVDRRVASLQREFDSSHAPPPGAECWPDSMLRSFFEDGTVTVEAATVAFEETGTSYISFIGVGLPTRVAQQPTLEISGGLLGAAERGDRSAFEAAGLQVANMGFALVELGAPASFWAAVRTEGKALWPRMRAGTLTDVKGQTHSGRDPSGRLRGDKFIESSRAAHDGACPAITTLDAALTLVGVELNAALRNIFVTRSDAFFACFPGGGSAYGGRGLTHSARTH